MCIVKYASIIQIHLTVKGLYILFPTKIESCICKYIRDSITTEQVSFHVNNVGLARVLKIIKKYKYKYIKFIFYVPD